METEVRLDCWEMMDGCVFTFWLTGSEFIVLIAGQLSKSVGEESSGSLEDRSGGEEFSLKELYAVQEIQSQPDLLRLLVQ